MPKDFWATIDPKAVDKLVPHVLGKTFAEPCAGNGDLCQSLEDKGLKCLWESDIREETYSKTMDALDLNKGHLAGIDLIITNPPFSWGMLQPLLEHLPTLRPTWLLLPSSFMHTVRTRPYMKKCSKVISIGRMFWVFSEGKASGVRGKEDFCWYLFGPRESDYGTKLIT